MRHVVEVLADKRVEALDYGEGKQRDTSVALTPVKNTIELADLCFKYSPQASRLSVDHLSASIPLGSYVVLCGGSGSGKSTVLNLMMQFRRATEGKLLFDGVDVLCTGAIRDFKKQIGVVFQETMIINGTVAENISYGLPDVTDSDVIAAAKKAEVDEVIMTLLPNGYDTLIGQADGAVGMSGGQLQRVCLARALCRKPRLLMLDEATSALDPKTEASVIETLEKLTVAAPADGDRCTIISVSHHPSTAANASHILVLEQGKLAETGTYTELVDKRGLFRKLVDAQKEDQGA